MTAAVWQLQHLGISIECRCRNYEEISHGSLYINLFGVPEKESKLKATSTNAQNLLFWAVFSTLTTW